MGTIIVSNTKGEHEMGIDAIIAVAGLILPPAIDFIKKKFLAPEADTPEATMSSLATTKPEVLPAYLTSVTGYLKAQIEFFNRDVSGTPSLWVINLRAAIRPFGVIASMVILASMFVASYYGWKPDPASKESVDGVRYTCELIAASWFGTRISVSSQQ
jgi:hypothetical protein